MFAKRAKQSPQQQPPTDDGSQTAQSGLVGEAAVERLEAELDEQRSLATTLCESLDAATFKIEILEKSYAKQLAEARDKRAVIEAELEEKNQILANLGDGHEHTLRELNDALTVIKVLKKERDKLRKQIAEGGFRPAGGRPTKAQLLLGESLEDPKLDASADTSGETINALIANTGWAERKPELGSRAQATEQADTPHAEMIAPDLVFTDKDKDDER